MTTYKNVYEDEVPEHLTAIYVDARGERALIEDMTQDEDEEPNDYLWPLDIIQTGDKFVCTVQNDGDGRLETHVYKNGKVKVVGINKGDAVVFDAAYAWGDLYDYIIDNMEGRDKCGTIILKAPEEN